MAASFIGYVSHLNKPQGNFKVIKQLRLKSVVNAWSTGGFWVHHVSQKRNFQVCAVDSQKSR